MSCRLLFLLLLAFLFCTSSGALAVDEENCLLCHRYSGLGRIDKEGRKHLYYVNESLYNQSVHAKVRCGECHTDIKGFPHGTVKKVDCATVCHLVDPSTKTPFSHAKMIEKYELSVHGRGPRDKPRQHPENLPTCTYCHDNRIYPPVSTLAKHEQGIAQEILDRCRGCHTRDEWTNVFYYHFTERLNQRRSSKRMVELCTSCHEDEEKMALHNIKTVGTFRDTFHWQAIKYGDQNAPNCITCHAPVGYFSHEIMPKTDPRSAIYKDNLVRTCSNQGGVQVCHPDATPSFAQGNIHPAQYKTGFFENKADALARKRDIEKGQMKPFQGLLGRVDTGAQSYYQGVILILIKYFYMVLIGGLIGCMIVHQILDYLATRRELSSKGRH
jgi:hypothetical protein